LNVSVTVTSSVRECGAADWYYAVSPVSGRVVISPMLMLVSEWFGLSEDRTGNAVSIEGSFERS
jgi:hypothetical protein